MKIKKMDLYKNLTSTKWEQRGFKTGLTIGLLVAVAVATSLVIAFHFGKLGAEGAQNRTHVKEGDEPRADSTPFKREDCVNRWEGGQNQSVFCRIEYGYPYRLQAKASMSLDTCKRICAADTSSQCKYIVFKRGETCRLFDRCNLARQYFYSTGSTGFDVATEAKCPNECPMKATRCTGRLVGVETARSVGGCLHKCEAHQPAKEHIQECQWVAFDQERDECRLLADCHYVTNSTGWLSAPKRCLDLEQF